MKLIDFVDSDSIYLNVPFSSKKRLFEELASKIGETPKRIRKIYNSLIGREKLGNTSMGNGFAIPHGKCLSDHEVAVKIFVLNQPSNFESVDDTLVQIVVCLAFPEQTDETHNALLREAGLLFKKHKLFKQLVSAKSKKEFLKIIMAESN